MSLTYPLIAWGTAADLSTWTQSGTCSVTSGQTDPFGGTAAYKLTDGDAGSRSFRYLQYSATIAGIHVCSVYTKQFSTDPGTGILFQNSTASYTALAEYAWSGGVGTVTAGGNHPGGVLRTVALANGWYLQRFYLEAAVANTMQVLLYPTDATASSVTSGLFYVRNTVLLDVPDSAMAWESSREGSSWVQGGSGVEDAWIQGTDFHYSASLGWVPQLDRDSPVSVSGWNGPLETTGVNCGVSAMLRAGRNKETLSFWADRSLIYNGQYGVDSYLVGPMGEAPTVEPNGDRRFTLELRNASKPYKPFETT